MSDTEEENYCFYGRPLEPYDEDTFPKKRPISVEEQVARDAQGRRRFHGAFTGGFSAGFFNTVGSLEGWTPSEFKSTRQEKAQNKTQKPEDFMDEEDFGEFGIAPQTIKATKDYSTSKKRKKQVFSDGPIPGEPVLHSLLTSGNETIGYLLLKNMGIKDKIQQKEEIEIEKNKKVYGCEMPRNYEIETNEEIEEKYEIPEIYKGFLKTPKTNTFGLGYVGLDQTSSKLFKSSKLVINEKNKKKLSISGQAFGVGAFEDDDEDIYVKDDMSRYDFELTTEQEKNKKVVPGERVFDDFIAAKNTLIFEYKFPLPAIPQSFSGKHKVKKSRFEPLPQENVEVQRKDVNPEIRAKYLGEDTPDKYTSSEKIKTSQSSKAQPAQVSQAQQPSKSVNEESKRDSIGGINLLFDRFVSASKPEDTHNILEKVERYETEHGTKDMREAVKMKMFGPLTRETFDWQPCAILCRRFNVPEPGFDNQELKPRKRTKNLIFEYQKHIEVNALAPGLSVQKEETENNKNATENEPEVTQGVSENTETSETKTITMEEEKQDKVEDKNEAITKDLTEKLNIAEKVDLFKAVFLSSSEDEEEDSKNEEADKNDSEDIQKSVLSDSLLPKIKPIKEGILSNIDFAQLQPSEPPKDKEKPHEPQEMELISNSYGPRLPEKLPQKIDFTNIPKSDDEDEWVEKDKIKKHKHKKKKKKHKK